MGVLPFRFYEDAFGSLEDLWALKTPVVDRRRFEQPGNLWRPVVFPVDTSIGHLQLRCFQLFNLVVRMAWEGPILLRILVWVGGAAVANRMLASVNDKLLTVIGRCHYQFRMRWPLAYNRVLQIYLGALPEQCLILEQLAVAHEVFGRKLSPAVEAELKEQTAQQAVAREERAQEQARRQQELDATIYGNRSQAPTSETMPIA